MIRLQPLIFGVTVALSVLILAACSGDSSNLGVYFQGRTLHINVLSIERVPELRYATVDPQQVVRHWRMVTSGDGQELVLVRLRVENHTAINAIVNVDVQAAELRDFLRGTYFPVDLNSRLHQDLRGQSPVTVRVSEGQCFDPNQMYISQDTTVDWVNEDSVVQFVNLDPNDDRPTPINPGESYSHTFSGPGNVGYQCGAEDLSGDGPDYKAARIVIESADSQSVVEERLMEFINGSFELQKGFGIEGWMVFEAPEGTEFRELRWRAGDSITIEF